MRRSVALDFRPGATAVTPTTAPPKRSAFRMVDSLVFSMSLDRPCGAAPAERVEESLLCSIHTTQVGQLGRPLPGLRSPFSSCLWAARKLLCAGGMAWAPGEGGGGGVRFQKWASVPGPLFCVRTDVATKGAGTQILARPGPARSPTYV